MKEEQFIPLNISYLRKNYKDRTILYLIVTFAIILIGVCITLKVHDDYYFVNIIGNRFFVIFGVLISIYLGLLFFRKVALKEKELMQLYKELINHSVTSINDLWDIYAIEGNLVRYLDDSTRVFIRCEKGYVIGREPEHDIQHYRKLSKFINYIINRNYNIDYYNWHTMNSNSEPLENLEIRLKNMQNKALQDIGNELLKECRELEYGDENSVIEYFVISSNNMGDTAFMESVIEEACKELEGSLYSDVRLCNANDVVDAVQTIYKIHGINLNELLVTQTKGFNYNVVKIEDILTYDYDDETPEEHNDSYQEFLELMNQTVEPKASRNLMKTLTRTFNKVKNKTNEEDLAGENYEEIAPLILDESEENLIDEENPNIVTDDKATNNINDEKSKVQSELDKIKFNQEQVSSVLDELFENLLSKEDNSNTEDNLTEKKDGLSNDESDNLSLDEMFEQFMNSENKVTIENKNQINQSNNDSDDDDIDLDAMFDEFLE